MAVQDSEKEGGTPPERGKGGAKGGGIGGWIKRNKLAATGVGAGALFLLLGHKGGKGESASNLNTQAQNERAIAAAGGVIPAAAPATPEGGSGTVGGENAGTLPGMVAPGTDPNLADALGQLGAGVSALAAAESEAAQAKEAGTPASPAAQKSKAKKKPAAKHPAKGKPNKGHSKNGVTVHGRHFPGAHGVHKGPVHKTHNGGTSQNVTVHYPGGSHTHTSHNGGEHWSDHTPGHNPPKRGTPVHSRPTPHASPPHHAPHPAVRDHRTPVHPKPKPHRRVTTA